jgi:hypothetical protein
MAKKKILTAHKLLTYLEKLKRQGNDLKKIEINIRENRDTDTISAEDVEEDLYDSTTNNILESIVLIGDTTEV